MALTFHHEQGTIRNFLKRRRFFEVCYDAQAVGARASHEISHMQRLYSALLSICRLSFRMYSQSVFARFNRKSVNLELLVLDTDFIYNDLHIIQK